VIFLAIWNFFVFVLMGYDKFAAQKYLWRVSERKLLGSALFMGAGGILLGMLMFRHKTLHPSFKFGVPILFILNIFFFYIASFVNYPPLSI